ncbi:MAG: DNA-binding domain-containing protein [Rhodoferax sp.]|nr:DNA-binding domain-containing protein [Rhodoferax sp.]
MTGWGVTTVKRHCREGKFKGVQKMLIDGNESWQIPIASLPQHAQAKYVAEVKAAAVARAAEIAPLPQAPAPVADSVRTRMMFDAYQRSGKVNKERAEAAHAVLTMFEALKRQGYSIGEAEKATLAKHNVSRATLYRHIRATKGYPVCEWLPRLSPKFKGGRPLDECSEEAYAYILGEYLNTSKTPFTVVMVHARALAPSKGWVLPNNSSIWNRIKKEPQWMLIAGREGPKALEQSQPPVKRDHTTIGVNEVWFSDGHKVDLFCLWPDGTIARPFVIAWTDARSRAVLGFTRPRLTAPQTPPEDEWVTAEDGEVRNQTTGQKYIKSRLEKAAENPDYDPYTD